LLEQIQLTIELAKGSQTDPTALSAAIGDVLNQLYVVRDRIRHSLDIPRQPAKNKARPALCTRSCLPSLRFD
jgi:hypothetical protein